MRALRPFAPGDAELLLTWRNSEAHRRWSFNDRRIDPASHAAWFGRFLGDSRRVGFILEDDADGPLGQIRFDPASLPGTLTVSIGIAPDHIGRGIGTQLLSEAVARPEVTGRAVLVRAETFLENLPSRRIFEKGGFTALGEREREGRGYLEWARPVGRGLGGRSWRLDATAGDPDADAVRTVLAALGWPETTDSQSRAGVTIRLVGNAGLNEAAVMPDRGCGYLIPKHEPGITSVNIYTPELPAEACAMSGHPVDKIVALLAWISLRDRAP